MLDFILTFIKGVGSEIYKFLPTSPIQSMVGSLDGLTQGLGWLNWFIPISDCLAIMSVWLVAIGIFYGYRAIMHWTGLSS